ncbi:MAG: CRISPR-associated endonuclease Cas1 [Candidatus Thermoplasmatota archaeon]|nr:CRISPR-associated endonuclease Cas1 [Candidatus Thermoplasmatota archaeon]
MTAVMTDGSIRLLLGNIVFEDRHTKSQEKFKEATFPYDNIVVNSINGGYVSYQAIRLAMYYNIGITFLNSQGETIGNLMPYRSNSLREISQFKHYLNDRFAVAKRLEQSKLNRQIQLLNYLKQRFDFDFPKFQSFNKCKTVNDLLLVEGGNASLYWASIAQATRDFDIPFIARTNRNSREMKARDPYNSVLNFGYKLLDATVRRAISLAGLDQAIGFVHELRPMKDGSLAWDIMEAYRFIVDKLAIDIFENRTFTRKDFYKNTEYYIRLKDEACKKLINLFNIEISKKVKYKTKNYSWENIINMKVIEFAKTFRTDFSDPEFIFIRKDNKEFRSSVMEGKLTGKNKSTLFYRKMKIKQGLPLKIYSPR